jgi:phage gpG-like protein
VNSPEEFEALLEAMIAPAVNPRFRREDWRDVVEAMETEHESFFDRDTGPDGEAWQPLAPYTIAKKGHATILEEDGILRQSLTESGSPAAVRELSLAELVFGTSRENAWKHQEGHGRIPQRMHTGFSENLLDETVDLVGDNVIGKMVSANVAGTQ